MWPEDLVTTVPVRDLGEKDPVWAGIYSPIYEEAEVNRFLHEQFLEASDSYLDKYQATAYWRVLLERALTDVEIERERRLTILDLGSGGGNTVLPLFEMFPDARVVASDLSLPLLRALGGEVKRKFPQHDCRLLQLNAEEILFADGQFDLVVGGAVLHHLFAPDKAIAEVGRVLAPGGVALFFEPFLAGHELLARTLCELLARGGGWQGRLSLVWPGRLRLAAGRVLAHLPVRGDLSPEVIHAFQEMVRDIRMRSEPDKSNPIFRRLDDKWLFEPAQIEAWARAAGFRSVAIEPLNPLPNPLTRHVAALLHLKAEEAALPAWAQEVIALADASASPLIEGHIVLEK